MNAAEVEAAADGAMLIVHAVNPPGYRDWEKLVLPMIDNSIAAARRNRARILLPGTVYNYGADAFRLIGENAHQHPTTRKGHIRVELERRLEDATADGGMRATIVRAGDFFGPSAGNNWFSQGMVAAGRRPTTIRNPARPGIGHQWAYLPDLAETMARVVERDDAALFERYHFGGHWDADGRQMAEAVRRVLGTPPVRIRPLPWWSMRLAAPFVRMLRELLEMRYLWEQPVRLDNRHLLETLGEEPHTPLDDAIRATLIAMGCLTA